MFTLKNISLKPILFLFLLIPLLISAQSISADSLKTKKKPGLLKPILLGAKNTLSKPLKFLKKNEVEIGIGAPIFGEYIYGNNMQSVRGFSGLFDSHVSLTFFQPRTRQPYNFSQPFYSELMLMVKNFLFIYGARMWNTNNYGELELENANLLVENSATYYGGYDLLFGYEKSFPLLKKHIKGLSFDLGLLGMFEKSEISHYDYSYYFLDKNDDFVESNQVSYDASQTTNLSHNGESVNIYSGNNDRLDGYSTLEDRGLQNITTKTEDFILGIAPSFALSYELSDHFVLRWRVKPKIKKVVHRDAPQDIETKFDLKYQREVYENKGTSTLSVFFKF